MQLRLLDFLVCPECRGALRLAASTHDADGDIAAGSLACDVCRQSYEISQGIPRFVETHPADASFGFQWNRFREEQLDSFNGARLSSERIYAETGWTRESLAGKRVMELGCGAGRFLEVLAACECELVGVDVSRAVDAAAATVKGRRNVHIVQADAYKLPFRAGVFDACYCIGVAQHTPDPLKTLGALAPLLRSGGRVAVTVYERKPWTRLNGKYVLRPLTRRMNKRALLSLITGLMPVMFPITEILFRLPVLGRVFGFVIPVANYVEMRELSWRQRYRIALLDTFDRLAPEFDAPLTEKEVSQVLSAGGIGELRRLPNPGVNIVGSNARTTL